MELFSEENNQPVLARKRTRVYAALIDFIILMAGVILIAQAFGQTYYDEYTGSVGFHLEGPAAFLVFLYGLFLIPLSEAFRGQTMGKRIMKIEVIKVDNSDYGVGAAILRHLFDVIDCFFLIGLIVASNNPRQQRVGDLVASTIVVQKN